MQFTISSTNDTAAPDFPTLHAARFARTAAERSQWRCKPGLAWFRKHGAAVAQIGAAVADIEAVIADYDGRAETEAAARRVSELPICRFEVRDLNGVALVDMRLINAVRRQFFADAETDGLAVAPGLRCRVSLDNGSAFWMEVL